MKYVVRLWSALAAASVAAALSAPAEAQVYVRADVGYGWNTPAAIKDRNGAKDPDCSICVRDNLNKIGDSPMLGAGIGYRFSDLLRADLDLGYRGWSRLKETNAPGTTFTSDIRSLSVMATGYLDLPIAWEGVRPYVGGGLGWANTWMGKITQTFPKGGGSETDPSGSIGGLAWALTAGLTVPVNESLSVDLAYRYVNLGRLRTSSGTSTVNYRTLSMPLATNGVQGYLRANELLVSARYAF